MATATTNNDPGIQQTATTWKGLIVDFHAAMLAIGMTQTADSGQVNPATIAALPGASSSGGYILYKFNDTLSASAPLVLRVDFFTSTGSTGKPSWRFLLGTGSDGAGNITGAFGTFSTVATAASTTGAQTTTSYFAHGEGYLVVALWAGTNTANTGGFFIVERHRDPSGAATSGGVFIAGSSGVMTTYDRVTRTGLVHTASLAIPAFASSVSPSLGAVTTWAIPMVVVTGQTPFQPTVILAVAPPDRPGSPFSGKVNGVAHTYMAPPTLASPNSFAMVNGSLIANATAFRFD